MKFTENEARSLIAEEFKRLGINKLLEALERESGAKVHNTVIYKLLKGGSKPAFVIMLAYVLANAKSKET
ncbi:hypothetical protein [Vibrio jasicida]|uniref:hypothetical protein n=1 Tax=Vibrio jasicida TaxID=766224 RepID=UPI0005EDCB1D|nr:hypothetical protein [Vibrio jasicida]